MTAAVDPGGAGLRLLVVERRRVVAWDLELRLRRLGHTVCANVSTVDDGIRRAEELQPDLVLMDLALDGEVDGVEAARRLRGRVDVPVVFLTEQADQATLGRAAAVEPYGYLLKPCDERELGATIVLAVCKHRAFTELDRRVRERTEALAHSETKYFQLAAVAELGLDALATRDLGVVMERAIALVAATLRTELTQVLERDADGGRLLLRAGTGWRPGVVGRAAIPLDAGHALLAPDPLVVEDLAGDARLAAPPHMIDHGVTSGASVVIPAPARDGLPWGVLGAHTAARRGFSPSDVNFLQAVANVIAGALLRADAEAQARAAERAADAARLRSEQAEAAVREREDFISVAAHELRTPLTTLQLKLEGLVSLFARARPDERLVATAQGRLDGAMRQSVRLVGLVERLLDVSRIVTGGLTLSPEPFDLAASLDQLAADFREQAEQAQVELRVAVSGDLAGRWDKARVEQVLANLLANALKYGAGRPVELRAAAEGDAVSVSVADRGIGIPPGDLERVFGRFQRAVPIENYGGLGLGLYIARHIVEAHGGAIRVSSAVGAGTTFTVELPRSCPALATRGGQGGREAWPRDPRR